MRTLKERLQKRAENYRRAIAAELVTQKYIDKIAPIIEGKAKFHEPAVSEGVYVSIYISCDEVKIFEDEIMPALSRALWIKWTRDVNETHITYTTKLVDNSIYIYLICLIYPSSEEECKIMPVATGKRVKVQRTFESEEEEIHYVVDCGGK